MSRQQWSNDPAYRCWRNVATLRSALVTGCATVEPLMPTPTYMSGGANRFCGCTGPSPKIGCGSAVYHRSRAGTRGGQDASLQRRSLALDGVQLGHGRDWPGSTGAPWSPRAPSKPTVPLDLTLGPTKELGRFPLSPTPSRQLLQA
jgi:hypothetical protein